MGLLWHRSSGAAFRNHVATYMEVLGCFPSKADLNVWLRPAREYDGSEYYEYVLLYIDDYLAISENLKASVERFEKKFKM